MFRYAVVALLFMLTGSRALMFCTGDEAVNRPLALTDTIAQLDGGQHWSHLLTSQS